jgi:hypothetical protein
MRRDLAIAAIVFVVAMARSLADGVGLSDESWFLQVLSRLAAGDLLYKDVAIGVTPLSVYVTSWVTAFSGIEIVAVKLVTNACFAATAFFTARISAAAGLPRGVAWIAAAAMLIWGRPHGNPPYTAMAMTAFTAAAWLVLIGGTRVPAGDPGTRLTWLATGMAAGFAAASKQNVGALAIGAVAVAIVISRRGTMGNVRGPLMNVGAGAALALGAVLLPVVISGAGNALWDYGVAAKGTYVQTATVSFGRSAGDWLDSLVHPLAPGAWSRALHGLTVMVPIATVIAAAMTWRRLDRHARLLVVFAVAATLTALPRWDRFHMTYAVPFHVLAIAAAWAARAGHTAADPRLAPLALTLAGALVMTPGVSALANGHQPSTIDRFRGPLLPPGRQADLLSTASRLREAAASRPLFILDTEAGFWYLVTGLSNPTPFDIPAATSIGTGGVPWLLARLGDGRLDQVCVGESRSGPLALETVAAYVRERFARGPEIGPCRIYRALPDPAR